MRRCDVSCLGGIGIERAERKHHVVEVPLILYGIPHVYIVQLRYTRDRRWILTALLYRSQRLMQHSLNYTVFFKSD